MKTKPKDLTPLDVTQVTDDDFKFGPTVFVTGHPVTFSYMRFKSGAQKHFNFGAQYGQDIEPAGRYMLLRGPANDRLPEAMESGTVRFNHPLVLHNRFYGEDGWKARLRRFFKAKGARLSEKMVQAGYDGIVTVLDGYVSEIVALNNATEISGEETPVNQIGSMLMKNKHHIGAFVDPISTFGKEFNDVVPAALRLLPYKERILFGLDCAYHALPAYEKYTKNQNLRILIEDGRRIVLGGAPEILGMRLDQRANRLAQALNRPEYEGELHRRSRAAADSAINALTFDFPINRNSYYQVTAARLAVIAVNELSHKGIGWVLKLLDKYLRNELDNVMKYDLPSLEGEINDVTQATIIRGQSYEKLTEIMEALGKTSTSTKHGESLWKKANWTSSKFQEITDAFDWIELSRRIDGPLTGRKSITPLDRLCSFRFEPASDIIDGWQHDIIPKPSRAKIPKIGWAGDDEERGGGGGGRDIDLEIRQQLDNLPEPSQLYWVVDVLNHILPSFQNSFPGNQSFAKVIKIRKELAERKITRSEYMMATPWAFPFPGETDDLLAIYYMACMSDPPIEVSRRSAEALSDGASFGPYYHTERLWQLDRLKQYVSGAIGKREAIGGKKALPAKPWTGRQIQVGDKVRTCCPIREEASVCRNWNARLDEICEVVFLTPNSVWLAGHPRPFKLKNNGSWVLEGYTINNGPYLEPVSKTKVGARRGSGTFSGK